MAPAYIGYAYSNEPILSHCSESLKVRQAERQSSAGVAQGSPSVSHGRADESPRDAREDVHVDLAVDRVILAKHDEAADCTRNQVVQTGLCAIEPARTTAHNAIP